MERRLFIGRLSAMLGIGLVPAAAKASTSRQVESQRSPLAGFQYHQGETVWPQLAVGMWLDLVREPDNSYDPRAVRVEWQGRKLGYVSRVDNAAVSHLLDQGRAVTARVVALRQSDDPWERIEFSVFLLGEAAVQLA